MHLVAPTYNCFGNPCHRGRSWLKLLPRLPQIDRIETFGEPIHNGTEQSTRLVAPPPRTEEPR